MFFHKKTSKDFINYQFSITLVKITNIKISYMGKGDKKTRRGKITAGSYGVTRPKKKVKPTTEDKKKDKKDKK